MSDCQKVLANLSDYLDHELPKEMASHVAEHLTGCESCEDAAEGLLRSIEACKTFASDERPGALPDEVKSELLAAYRRVQETIRKRKESEAAT